MSSRPLAEERVRAVFEGYPAAVRASLLELRALVFETAEELDEVGPITESLRWGEPAYLTPSGTGTTLRLHAKDATRFALYVHCQTDLIATFRAAHGDRLSYEGSRAVVFPAGAPLPREVLRDCIALVLTYKLRKRRTR